MAEQGLSDEEIKKNLAENLSDITKGLKNKAEKLGEVIADV
jgi:ethanolamine ammonia-lyase small subunit